MRNHPYGTIQEAVQSSYRASGHTNEEIAELLGVRGSTISYGAEMSEARPGGLGVNYLHRLGRMRPAAAVPIAQHFARLAGGVFQPVEVPASVTSLFAHCGTVAKECGEAQAAALRAAEMASADACEAAEREIAEAVEALLRARAMIQERRGAA